MQSMVRKIILPLVILIVLAVVAYLLLQKDQTNTIKGDPTDFAVEDTARIDKVFLSDMTGNQTTLTRKKEGWYVNDEMPANKVSVDILLGTLKRMTVKRPVSLKARNNVIKDMASSAVKVELYNDGEKLKTIYVGGSTPGELGTYMALDIGGEKEPYVIHIPGFDGYLSTRFFADPEQWRSRKVFDYNPVNIQSVSVSYKKDPDQSFIIKRTGSGYTLTSPKTNETVKDVNQNNIKRYLVLFKNIQYERVLEMSGQMVRDSLGVLNPDVIINVTADDRPAKSVTLYAIKPPKVNPERKDEDLKTFQYFATSNARHEVMIMQSTVLDPVLQRFDDFLKGE